MWMTCFSLVKGHSFWMWFCQLSEAGIKSAMRWYEQVVWDVENDWNGIMLLIREKYSHEFKIYTLVINTTNYKSWKINWFPSRK